MSQLSEGGFSDIICDVDKFIEENGMTEDVGHLLGALPNGNVGLLNSKENDDDCKAAPQEFFGSASYPPQLRCQEKKFPPDQPINLSNDEFPGPFNFEVYIIPSEQKTPWEYSPKLNKIFIGINLKFPVAFSLKNRPDNIDFYIRVTPVYSQVQYFQELVHRCVGHQHPQDPSNKGLSEHIYQHIMRCSNDDVRYFGDKNNSNRLNVVVPLANPQAGTDIVREFFHFVCKNSCPLGMNRRPIELIFTLEDEDGNVHGRRVVSVRICSCPKRDKEKEERDVDKGNNSALPHGKKRKFEKEDSRRVPLISDNTVDTRVYPLNINIVGKTNQQQVLKFCHDLMAGEIIRLEGKSGQDIPFRRCLNDIKTLINKSSTE